MARGASDEPRLRRWVVRCCIAAVITMLVMSMVVIYWRSWVKRPIVGEDAGRAINKTTHKG